MGGGGPPGCGWDRQGVRNSCADTGAIQGSLGPANLHPHTLLHTYTNQLYQPCTVAVAAVAARCLLRDKRAQPAEARLARVLQGPLFHKVRDNKALVNKVSVVKGDIMEPELGLTEVDRAAIVEGVDVIIHCAADIRLECCIQVRRVYVYM